MLEVLLAADGAVVSAEELLERVWDENADPFTRTVVVTLTRLRRKLGEPEVIETVVGAGYRAPMTPPALSALGRLWPRRVRARLAVVYTVLFLLAGAVLLALTYTLVVHVLLPAPGHDVQDDPAALRAVAEAVQATAHAPPRCSQECKRAIAATGGGPSDRDAALHALQGASVIALGVLAIASIGLGWLVSGRALRPVRSITEAARRASELRLGQRLALTGPDDEFKQLADTFDVMLERLDAAFTSQKRFVANAAHELRTPLTAMRTAIEVTLSKPTRTPAELEAMAAKRQAIGRARRSHHRGAPDAGHQRARAHGAGVAGSRHGRRGRARRHARRDRSAPHHGASDAPARARPRRSGAARAHDLQPRRERRAPQPPRRLDRSPHALQHADSAVFEIANTGPTVSAEQLPTLFEPFARAEQRLNPLDGVGLGLSIAQAIADAHNATITAHPRSGGGLELSVAIPSSRAAADGDGAELLRL